MYLWIGLGLDKENEEFIVGGIIEKDGKILMVQEKKKRCFN